MSRYKVILLGVGFFGSKWLQLFLEDKECEVVAVADADSDFELLRNRGIELNCATFTDYTAAIEKTDADIAVVILPAALHTDAAKRALKKGMHVLTEKPLALDRADAVDIIAFKKNYPDLLYVVDQNYRWRPHNYTIKCLVKGGKLGRLQSMLVEFRQPEDLRGYRKSLEMPLLQDVSIHHFDLIRYFTGSDAIRILAHSYHQFWSIFEGKETSNVLIEMENGVKVNYCGTWACRGKPTTWDGNFVLTGEKGSLVLNESEEIIFFAADGARPEKISPLVMEDTELHSCWRLFKKAIAEKTSHETTLEKNFNSFLMVCSAVDAARTNQWMDCR
jgi:predicted dehydrogenase